MLKLVLLAGLLLLIMTAAERLLPQAREIPPEIGRSPDPSGSPQHAYLHQHSDDDLIAKP